MEGLLQLQRLAVQAPATTFAKEMQLLSNETTLLSLLPLHCSNRSHRRQFRRRQNLEESTPTNYSRGYYNYQWYAHYAP